MRKYGTEVSGETTTRPAAGASAAPRDTAPPGSGVAIDVRGVEHFFVGEAGATQALQHTDLQIGAGEFLAIVGPSGCGKTTLLNMIAGLITPSSGKVLVNGARPDAADRSVGYLFARDALLPWRTVLGNAELSMEIFGVEQRERRKRAEEMLNRVGLASFLRAYPAQLSQGMRQRVAIARTLAPLPKIVLLDEPFSALDAQTKLLLQETFSALWQEMSATIVLITHDLHEAVAMADRVVISTTRPGRIKKTLEIDLPRPRSVVELQSNDHYHELYEEAWASLREEVI